MGEEVKYDDGGRYVGGVRRGGEEGEGEPQEGGGEREGGGGEGGGGGRRGVGAKRDGFGTYFYPNGDVFQGHFVGGRRHGQGVYKYAEGGMYDGEWLDDKMHGKGRFMYASGNVFEGQWVRDMPHGIGKFVDGDVEQEIQHDMGKTHFPPTLPYRPSLPRSIPPFRPPSTSALPPSLLVTLLSGLEDRGDFATGGWAPSHGEATGGEHGLARVLVHVRSGASQVKAPAHDAPDTMMAVTGCALGRDEENTSEAINELK
eukprot:764708-Hanusia_phi.AAC.4